MIPFGATYSATAVSIELAIKEEIKGMSIMLGRLLAIATTEIDMRGSPIRVTKVVLINGGSGINSILLESYI